MVKDNRIRLRRLFVLALGVLSIVALLAFSRNEQLNDSIKNDADATNDIALKQEDESNLVDLACVGLENPELNSIDLQTPPDTSSSSEELLTNDAIIPKPRIAESTPTPTTTSVALTTQTTQSTQTTQTTSATTTVEPTTTGTPTTSEKNTVTVGHGEGWWHIGVRAGVNYKYIAVHNDKLWTDNIYVGETFKIPTASEIAEITLPTFTEATTKAVTTKTTAPRTTTTKATTKATTTATTTATTAKATTKATTIATTTKSTTTTAAPTTATPVQGNSYMRDAINRVYAKTNKIRKANGVAPLQFDWGNLYSAASKRASEQAISFSHTRPDGRAFYTVARDFGISYSTIGENLVKMTARAFSPEEVVQGWFDSPGHRKTLLNSKYSKIAIGYYEANGFSYYVQLFLR